MRNKQIGSFIGLAIGDAVGGPMEFIRRDFRKVDDMTSGGIHGLAKGEWTDDTTMAYALSESLSEVGFSLKDQLDKYCLWLKEGKYSTRDHCFDIGCATKDSLEHYLSTGDVISPYTEENYSGNGSIMRISPIAIKYHAKEDTEDFKKLMKYSRESSLTTHPNVLCQDCCASLVMIINRCFYSNNKEEILNVSDEDIKNAEIKTQSVIDVLKGSYKNKERDQIESSGYVLTSLEAALWCFFKTENYNDAILLATNLGNDADTMAAITGQIAGAFYGFDSINKSWLDQLMLKNELIESVNKLIDQP